MFIPPNTAVDRFNQQRALKVFAGEKDTWKTLFIKGGGFSFSLCTLVNMNFKPLATSHTGVSVYRKCYLTGQFRKVMNGMRSLMFVFDHLR